MSFGKTILEELFKPTESRKQALIIHFDYGKDLPDDFDKMRDGLDSLVEKSNLGEYDGHEIAMDLSDGSFYLYSTEIEALFKHIRSYLLSYDFMIGANVYMRFGEIGSGAKEIAFELQPD